MSKSKKRAALLLSATMLAAALAGCGASSNTDTNADGAAAGDDHSEHVVLTMYCIGDEGGIHAEEHINKINEILNEKINAELNPVMVSWGDYRKKLPMVWASGEPYDLTYAADWAGYFTEGSKGAFMDITELLPVYAPETYARMQEDGTVSSVSIGGKICMVPTDVPEYTSVILNYREDLRKKYNCPEIVDQETLNAYMQAIKDNEPGMQAFGDNGVDVVAFQEFLNEQDWSRPVDNSSGFFVYDLKDPTKVFNVVDTPEYEEYIAKRAEYYQKGFVSQSIMADTDAIKDQFLAGQYGTYFANFNNSNLVYQDVKVNHPDWEIGYYCPDLAGGTVEQVAPSNNGVAVGAYSEHPERALEFIELMNTDRELYNLVIFGIEGTTYDWDEETGTFWIPEGVDPSEIALKNLGMGLKRKKFNLASKSNAPALNELEKQYAECSVMPGLAGFSVNQDNIAAEIAALKAVQDEYKLILEKGATDPTKGLETLRQKMKEAGSDKVMEEINAQITEFLANK